MFLHIYRIRYRYQVYPESGFVYFHLDPDPRLFITRIRIRRSGPASLARLEYDEHFCLYKGFKHWLGIFLIGVEAESGLGFDSGSSRIRMMSYDDY